MGDFNLSGAGVVFYPHRVSHPLPSLLTSSGLVARHKVDLPAARWKVTDAAPKISKRASQRGEPREPTCHLIVARPKLAGRQTTRLYHLLRRSDLDDGHNKQAAYKYSDSRSSVCTTECPKVQAQEETSYHLPATACSSGHTYDPLAMCTASFAAVPMERVTYMHNIFLKHQLTWYF
jgi:hypothetical protein